MTTRGYLEKVEASDVEKCNARDVTERPCDAVVLVIDDERPTSLDTATIPHFTLAGTEPAGVLDL